MGNLPTSRLRTLGRELASGMLHLFYPGVCAFCEQLLAEGETLACRACRTALTSDSMPVCPRCGATVGPYAFVEDGCPACRHERFHFDAVIRLGPYEGLLRESILRMKYAPGEALAEILATLWVRHAEVKFRELSAEVVIPVPLHWWRHWRRGYNQSEAVARTLANHLRLPCRPRWLRRVRATPLQTQSTPDQRRANVREAFRARPRPRLRDKTVLLVDDVLTTGSTASEAARILRSAGAARIIVAVLARSER